MPTKIILYHALVNGKPANASYYNNVQQVNITPNGLLTFEHTMPNGLTETICSNGLPFKIINNHNN